MTKVDNNYYKKILDVYEPAMHAVSLAGRILERNYRKVSMTAIERCWKGEGLEIISMPDLVKNKMRAYAMQHNNDPDKIATCLVHDFRGIIQGYTMTPNNIRIQMKNMGLTPAPKSRWNGGGVKKLTSGACPRFTGKRSGNRKYFFSGSPDVIK